MCSMDLIGRLGPINVAAALYRLAAGNVGRDAVVE